MVNTASGNGAARDPGQRSGSTHRSVSQARRRTPGALVLRFLILALASCLAPAPHTAGQPSRAAIEQGGPAGWEDEPNELCWEHFGSCLECFEDFSAWRKTNGGAWRAALAAARKAGVIGAPPHAFPVLWIEAETFTSPKPPWEVAQHGNASGGAVLRGRYGHNAAFVRREVRVPRAGPYRLWSRYLHLKGFHASFRVRILPAEMTDREFGWQSTSKGVWLDHRFDFAEHGRKQPVLSRKDEPTGGVWESAPMVELPAGSVCLEIAGCIHSGPYTYRQVDCLVLTQDPLWRPRVEDRPAAPGGAGEPAAGTAGDAPARPRGPQPEQLGRPPSAPAREQWPPWRLRPGAFPPDQAPLPLARCWREWRDDLISRLARADTPTLHLKRLARQNCFDADWNLIGTPAQVAEEIRRRRRPGRATDPWYEIIEAEGMADGTAGWIVESNTLSGGGKRVRAHYCDGLAEKTAQVRIPHDGQYRLWVHHSRIKGYTNIFQVRLERNAGKEAREVVLQADFGEQPVDSGGGYRMIWAGKDVELAAGDCRVTLSKNRGKGPYAYRHVDRIMLTDDLDWQPHGLREPPLSPGRIRGWPGERAGSAAPGLVLWRPADVWRGFDANASRPGRDDDVMPNSVALDAAPGEMASAVLHLTNPGEQARTVVPLLTGPAADRFRWRVVAYVLSKPFGWQPMPLLRRRRVTVPPCSTASLWLTLDARGARPGRHAATLTLGEAAVTLTGNVEDVDLSQTSAPLVGGWTRPYDSSACWRELAAVGVNIVHGAMIPKSEMTALGIRLCNVTLGIPKDAEAVARVVAATRALGLDYSDWSWELFDEPSDKTAEKWAAGARRLKDADPAVRIWCNPGDVNVTHTAAVGAMAPFVDVFCPFINHFGKWPQGEHAKLIAGIGKVKLFYTTPCAAEKAPHAPLDMLLLGREAARLNRDGWEFFCLKNYYEYCNTPWDDVWAYHRDQAVSIYPGARRRAIGTRNLEALREAVRRWRRQKAHKTPGAAP